MARFEWTPLRTAFCEQMLICDFNATAAYKAAGGTAKHADRAASQLMAHPEIQERIEELKAQRSERTKIDADYVLHQADEMLQQCLGKKPVKKVVISDGVPTSVDVHEFNAAGAGKALELLGKHVDVAAFKDRIEHSGKLEVEGLTDEQLDARIAALEATAG